jgi:hypothetical protein
MDSTTIFYGEDMMMLTIKLQHLTMDIGWIVEKLVEMMFLLLNFYWFPRPPYKIRFEVL